MSVNFGPLTTKKRHVRLDTQKSNFPENHIMDLKLHALENDQNLARSYITGDGGSPNNFVLHRGYKLA